MASVRTGIILLKCFMKIPIVKLNRIFPLLVVLFLVAGFWHQSQSWWTISKWLGGLGLGIWLMKFDEWWGWRYYSESRGFWPRPSSPQLITRSPIFLLSYWVLAVFLMTSSGSYLGMGLILGMGLVLISEMYQWRRQPSDFSYRFYQQTKTLTPMEVGWVTRIFITCYLAMFLVVWV